MQVLVCCRRAGRGGEADGIARGDDEEYAIVVRRGEGRTAKVVQKYQEIQASGTSYVRARAVAQPGFGDGWAQGIWRREILSGI